REVPGAGFQVNAGAWRVRGEPLTVGERDHVVLVALPDGRAVAGRVQVEAPVRHEREVVLKPAVDALADGGAQGRGQVVGELCRQRRRVGTGDEAAERGRDLLAGDLAEGRRFFFEEGGQGRDAACRELELLDVLWSHPGRE